MTVKQLIEKLKEFPQDMDVILYNEDAEFTHFPLEYVEQKNVRFCEDPDDPEKEPYCDEECIVLSGD